MMKYVITSQSEGEGKGNTQKDDRTYIQMNIIGHTGRPTLIDTTHLIGLVLSLRIIQ